MQPSQATIPCLMNILGSAGLELQGKDKLEQSFVLRETASAVRDLAVKLRENPEQVVAAGMPQTTLYMKALEMVSKVTAVHNATRERGVSEREIETTVASALDECASMLESDAEALLEANEK
jgi:hypothetical protein